MTLSSGVLARLAERLPDCKEILVVGAVSVPEDSPALTGPVSFSGVMELEIATRFDLGLVLDPALEHAAAISRLRDVGCQRVLILSGGSEWTANDMRALGFLPVEPFDARPAYLYDSDLQNQPREWNNSRHWANPENFDKYRW